MDNTNVMILNAYKRMRSGLVTESEEIKLDSIITVKVTDCNDAELTMDELKKSIERKAPKLTAKILKEVGSGGGCPDVSLTGKVKDIIDYVAAHYEYDQLEIEFTEVRKNVNPEVMTYLNKKYNK